MILTERDRLILREISRWRGCIAATVKSQIMTAGNL